MAGTRAAQSSLRPNESPSVVRQCRCVALPSLVSLLSGRKEKTGSTFN
jgi:hypothetical protein